MKAPSQGSGSVKEAENTLSTGHKKRKSSDDLSFIGVRVPAELHARLYRAKATLELQSGKFYGMGRLMERVITSGLVRLEAELGLSKEQ